MSSYIKFLSRNKLYTAIEAVGLAVSLAFVIIIGSYAWQQSSITRESPDRKNIYCFGMPGPNGSANRLWQTRNVTSRRN